MGESNPECSDSLTSDVAIGLATDGVFSNLSGDECWRLVEGLCLDDLSL